MTSGLAQLQRLEQRMTYVRWFALVFGAISLLIITEPPPGHALRNAWLLMTALGIGSFAIWGASGRVEQEEQHLKLSAAAFAFDALIVMGVVWVFAYETVYTTWMLLFILPLEGALRYRLRGALFATGLVGAFFLVQSAHRADLLGEPFDYQTWVFVVGMTSLIAGVTGSMANQWHEKTLAYESQSLKLAEVDRLKDRFLAITSHEIRGPLTAIIAGIDTVRKRRARLTPEQTEKLLEMVASQAHQLARLVDDLQVTSQLQSGQLTLDVHPADLEDTINQALEAAASKRRQHHLQVFVSPLNCEIDPARVGQIVRNLVENAYKYTPDETKVSLTAAADGSGIVIEVSDEGPGIPADKRDQMFKAFSRIQETAAGQEGVGLGLYVVSQLVGAMKGRIDVASSERGTTFTIRIPCRTSSAESPVLGVVKEPGPAEGSG